MQFMLSLLLLGLPALATLRPALSNSRGYKPKTVQCKADKVTQHIQAAECGFNTRTHRPETFAVFQVNHTFDKNHGAPYGNCGAYTCTAPTSDDLVVDEDYWTFFWNNNGYAKGPGMKCIQSSADGSCGCENSDGHFVYNGSDCV